MARILLDETNALAASESVTHTLQLARGKKHFISVSGAGSVLVETAVGTDTNFIPQTTISGGSASVILELPSVQQIRLTETTGVSAVVATLTSLED